MQLGLESPTHAIVDKSLGCIPSILAILDFSTIKNELFPVIAAVFSKTISLGIKIRGLEALVILCGGSANENTDLGDGLDGNRIVLEPHKPNSSAILDKYTVQEKIVPLLKAIKTKEPAVMMAALAVFRQVGKIADAEFLALDVLPMLWSFSLESLLNLEQFQEFMNLIKSLSSKIEQEQTRKLRNLSSNSNVMSETSRSNDAFGIGSSNSIYNSNETENAGETDFERLVLGKSGANENHILGQSSRSELQQSQPTRAEPPLFAWSTPALNSRPSPSSRAITPDQTLNGFATLKPASNNIIGNSSATANKFSSFAPMQPSPISTSVWPLNATAVSAVSLSQQPSSQSTFFIPPPPTSKSPFPAFSIAPPPTQYQRSNSQPSYGKGLDSTNKTGSAMTTSGSSNQMQPRKSGLDAYESLL